MTTGKTAREFFEKLQNAGVKHLVDVRLNNVSQLAGFTKKRDLEYFLKVIADIDYTHKPELAPTKEILDGYKKKQIDWNEYERHFKKLLQQREPDKYFKPENLNQACLLCSEIKPEHCHRRLVAEYLKNKFGGNVVIHHL
ncbi:DUF488 family protein [Candidatus Latescibacterota bacterium]